MRVYAQRRVCNAACMHIFIYIQTCGLHVDICGLQCPGNPNFVNKQTRVIPKSFRNGVAQLNRGFYGLQRQCDATTRHEARSPWHVTRQTSHVIRNGGIGHTPFFIVCQRPLVWTAWGAAQHAEAVGQGAAFGHNAMVVEGWAQGVQRLGVGG